MTLFSRVLGYGRDVVVAGVFGAGAANDAFVIAFRIPNLLRRMFAEGAFSAAFVPVFADYRANQSPEALQQLVNRVSGTLLGVLLLITTAGIVAAPWVVTVFAAGYLNQPAQFQLTVDLLRLMFPYLLFISLTALAGGILNSCGRFAVPAVTPALLNLVLIGAALLAAPHFQEPIYALAGGVFLAGLLQLAFQLPFLWRLNLLPRPRWAWQSAEVQRVFGLMVPMLFGASVTQIGLIINTLMASLLVTGSVSWLYYADRLMEFPQGLLGAALGTVLLPQLARQFATHNEAQFAASLDWGLRMGLLVGVPSAIGLGLLAEPILAALFQRGAFTADDARQSSLALTAYSLGLVPFVLIKVLASGFFARQNTKTPVKIGLVALAVNVGTAAALMPFLAHTGLALATSLGASVNAMLLLILLYRQGIYRCSAHWRLFLVQLLLANTALFLALPPLFAYLTALMSSRLGVLALLIPLAVLGYGGLLVGLGLRLRHVRP